MSAGPAVPGFLAPKTYRLPPMSAIFAVWSPPGTMTSPTRVGNETRLVLLSERGHVEDYECGAGCARVSRAEDVSLAADVGDLRRMEPPGHDDLADQGWERNTISPTERTRSRRRL